MNSPANQLNPADLQAIFGLEPANAIAYLKAKGYAITWHWQDILDQAHDHAFTVAKPCAWTCSATFAPPWKPPYNRANPSSNLPPT
ncbi:hypothetical protein [Pseudomonas corrugata]